MESISKNNKLYTSKEIAEIFKISQDRVRKWTQSGYLPCIKLSGRHIRVTQKQLDDFIKSQEKNKPDLNTSGFLSGKKGGQQ